jgi:adenine phosphoribosyltransferase
MTEAKTAGSEPGQQDARLLFDHYLDHPKQGVSFWGVSRFLSRPELHEIRTVTLGNLAKQVQEWRATKIACLDSRGYLVGGMIVGALHASSVVGLVPVMKRGKLPESAKGTLVSSQYVTEYSRVDGLVIAAGAITDTDRVVVVDDLVATGGTLDNLIDLIHSTTKAKVDRRANRLIVRLTLVVFVCAHRWLERLP